jgi:hypothetical protein
MNTNQYVAVTSYTLAVLNVLSWLLLCPPGALQDLPSKGFSRSSIESLPEFLQPMYEGIPNSITLLCYILFAFSAFLVIRDKKPGFRFVSISSFVMLFVMLCCL